ncbi:hypothetical protein K490DRAFT_61407 [Saccharata proteae CBS 121410]|uniref:HAUS augmin-like complex subunit 6 N-terminal domain-containing protein n=1 Tax=Saccharata proteae CBS 121410 TaxID=1314787 RepID=A0A9P4M3L1_9PEZI|nr:hypothetical protein K490DRAFT_61407 [Saccharata proteae CBS 121410]
MSRTTNLTTNSSAAGPPASSLQRSLSLKSATLDPSNNPALFVTNLRLLNFDLLPDWPDITTQTLSTRDAQQNQKNRIRCVEWALFRLFEAYDAEETREKLQPFFPPLEPLQSINLRAALYRSLEKLKKNGVLGRETVLRKSMLDECKGDKLTEILVIFSTAVLQKAVLDGGRSRRHVTIAQRLATAGSVDTGEQASLLPLAIAHKAALTKVLRRKSEQRARYHEFEELLELRSQEIQKQNGQCNAALEILETSEKEPADAGHIQKTLNQNWLGNRDWLGVMIHGDKSHADDRLFGKAFDQIWPTVKEGEPLEEPSAERGLLEDLEARVKGQQDRLQQWKAFHARIGQDNNMILGHSTPRKRGSQPNFNFNRHQKLRFGPQGAARPSEDASLRDQKTQLAREYDGILEAMRSSLDEASRVRVERRPPPRPAQPRTTSIPVRPAVHDVKVNPAESRGSSKVATVAPQIEVSPSPAKPFEAEESHTDAGAEDDDSRSAMSPRPVTALSIASDQQSDAFSLLDAYLGGSPEATRPQSTTQQQFSSPPPAPASEPDSEPPDHSPIDIEERLAEDILASVAEGTPSPVKKPRPRLSLMERTRMSMMGQSRAFPIEEAEDEEPIKPLATANPQEASEIDKRASLLERTRQSMALMEKLPPRPQPPRARNSISGKSRQSLYPVNQWESPRKVSPLFEDIEEVEQQKAKEDLFSGDVQYENVFKSRPKIAVSPMLSPQLEDSGLMPDSDGGLDGGSGDDAEDDDYDYDYGSSPLRGKGR